MKNLTASFTFIFLTLNHFVYASEKPVLTVYSPDYFASEWGPGPIIKSSFEEICNCELKFVSGDLLPRLRLEGEKTKADVVIGLDTDITLAAKKLELFAPHNQNLNLLTLPVDWTDNVFLPFDWSYLAFVYDNTKLKTPPTSFTELVNSTNDFTLIIQDPRTSISGLALVLWVKTVFKDEATKIWEKLSPKIVTVTQGWSEAYGLFLEGEADMVLSFTTSPAYHSIAEDDDTKSAAIFDEGHYTLVELAGKIMNTDNPELADQFMEFILSETFQKAIPTSNWSYPAALSDDKLPKGFKNLPKPKKGLFLGEVEAEKIRKKAIDEWVLALSK